VRALDDVDDRAQPLVPERRRGARDAAEIVAACRAATDLPLYAKLSPAAWDIAETSRARRGAGADGCRS
jgi:dihydroorotate dehydrogenase